MNVATEPKSMYFITWREVGQPMGNWMLQPLQLTVTEENLICAAIERIKDVVVDVEMNKTNFKGPEAEVPHLIVTMAKGHQLPYKLICERLDIEQLEQLKAAGFFPSGSIDNQEDLRKLLASKGFDPRVPSASLDVVAQALSSSKKH